MDVYTAARAASCDTFTEVWYLLSRETLSCSWIFRVSEECKQNTIEVIVYDLYERTVHVSRHVSTISVYVSYATLISMFALLPRTMHRVKRTLARDTKRHQTRARKTGRTIQYQWHQSSTSSSSSYLNHCARTMPGFFSFISFFREQRRVSQLAERNLKWNI